MMAHKEDGIYLKETHHWVGSRDDESTRDYLESLIRSDYERCHPGEMLADLKHRARFSKEDKGLLRDWMALAAARVSARDSEKRGTHFNRAA